MRKVSMETRDELLSALRSRYREACREEKGRILTEFATISGYHRKHAMRLLRCDPATTLEAPLRRRIYGDAVRTALVVLWEASDRVCGKRLRPLVPILIEAMERHGHIDLAPEVRAGLISMSAATIDRALKDAKAKTSKARRRGVASTALRRSIPVRTFADWGDPSPGYVEADLVSHSGPIAKGSFAWTFVLTDIATGWTECAPLLVREQTHLTAVLAEIRRRLPFELLGFDTDNDSAFINETVRDYCLSQEITFTRCRPYRKNDQAFVEQKNGSVVRRLVGYRRYEGIEAATLLAELYASARLFVNFFQPSFKLAEKSRDGAKVSKRYHAPATPCQRLLDHPDTLDSTKLRLRAVCPELDPIRLLQRIRQTQERLVALADIGPSHFEETTRPDLDGFLESLKTVWIQGNVRPTAAPKPKQKRERRRPDPLDTVTEDLQAWFEDEPWRTGREILERLQVEYPGKYPDSLLRTVQRRVKIMRSQRAHRLVFGGPDDEKPPTNRNNSAVELEASRQQDDEMIVENI